MSALAPHVHDALIEIADERGIPTSASATTIIEKISKRIRRDERTAPLTARSTPSRQSVQGVGRRHMRDNPKGSELFPGITWTYVGGMFNLSQTPKEEDNEPEGS